MPATEPKYFIFYFLFFFNLRIYKPFSLAYFHGFDVLNYFDISIKIMYGRILNLGSLGSIGSMEDLKDRNY